MPGVLHNSSRIQALLYRRMPADCEYPGKWRKMIPETNGYSLQPSNPAVRNGGSTVPKPFLKWAGGKQQLLADYEEYFPPVSAVISSLFLAAAPFFSPVEYRETLRRRLSL